MIAFRIASPADAPVVGELLHAFNTEFDTPTPAVPVLANRLMQHLTTGSLIAVLGGDPAIALALVSRRRSVWYDGWVGVLDELYVAPDHRDGGIGSALVAELERRLTADGCSAIEINVDGDDRDARRFYERHGYANHEDGTDEQLLYYFRELAR